MVSDNNHYKTTDSTLACYLITEGFYLTSINYSKLRYEYSFPHSTHIIEVANNYISGNALTDPAAFSRINKKLMRVIRKQVQWEDD